MTEYHIGVDLHRTVAQVCVLNERGEVHPEWRASLTDCEAGAKRVADLGEFAPRRASPSRRWGATAGS